MGKDAANTLFAENQAVAEQRDISGLKGEQLKGEQFSSSSGEFGDSRQFQGETILRPQGEHALPAQTTFKTEGAPLREEHFKTDQGFQDHHGITNIHDGRLRDGRDEPPLHENQLLQPALHANRDLLEDNTMRDATIYDGRSRPLENLDHLPLVDRVVAGVHAGDPLSSSTLKKSSIGKIKKSKEDKRDKKLKKDKKLEQASFGQDAHLRADPSLIPHDHLRNDSSLLSEQHLAGGAMLQKQEHFDERTSDAPIILKRDEHFISSEPRTETFIAAGENHIVKEEAALKRSLKKDKKDKKLKKDKHFTSDDSSAFNRDANLYDGKDAAFDRESHLNKDMHLAKDSQMRDAHLNRQDAFLVTEDHTRNLEKQDSGKKGGKLKDKLHRKKEQLKEKLGLKKEENLADSHAHPEAHSSATRGHEIATIKIPGIESGDRAAQDMVNHQAKVKKELNAELKEHAGHADHIAPSEISHGMGHMNLHENRAMDMPLQNRSEFQHDNQFAKDSQFPRDMGATQFKANDGLEKDCILAKKDLNAEITQAAGHGIFHPSDHILPSDVAHKQSEQFGAPKHQHLEGEQLAGFSGTNDALMRDNMLLKKDVNAEINKAAGHGFFGATDHIQPSDVAHKPGFTEMIKEKAIAVKDQLQPASATRHLEGEQLAGLHQTDDLLMKDNMLAKKEVNAEINKAAGHGFFGATDHIQPSDVAHKPGFTEMIKDKAIAIKDQLQPTPAATIDSRHLEAERLAGLSGTNDILMQDNMHAKKDVNAEIKKAGHGIFGTTDILPSDVAAKQPLHEARHLEGEELAGLSGTEDVSNIAAKKDVNAEIKKAAGHGFFGATDHIQPSDVAPKPGFTEMVKNAALAVKDQFFQSPAKVEARQMEAERLAGLSGTEDALVKDAKKDINADIKKAAGYGIFGATDHILPSAVAPDYPRRNSKHFEGEQLAGLSGSEDTTNILAKKDVNAEITKAGHGIFGAKDHIQPSRVAAGYPRRSSKHFEADQLAGLSGSEDTTNVLAKKDVNAEIKKAAGHGFFGTVDHIQPSAVAPKHVATSKHFEGEQLAGLSETEILQDNVVAKKEVNAEIKKAAGHGIFGATDHIQPSAVALHPPKDTKKEINAEIKKAAGHGLFGATDHILPSDVANQQPLGEVIKEKAAVAANVMKEQGALLKDKAAIAGASISEKAAVAGATITEKAAVAGQAIKAQAAVAGEKAAIAADSAKEKAASAAVSMKEKLQPASASSEATGSNESPILDNVVAKNEVNAEIKEHASMGSDQLLPSEIHGKEFGLDASKSSDILQAKKELNAEIKQHAAVSENILPSEISTGIAPGGVTVIHDGRSELTSEHLGSDRLKSEMEYEQAKGTATEGHHAQSMAEMIKAKVVTVASVALAGVNAVKGQLQAAAATRGMSEEEFPAEFQKSDFEKELDVGAVKDSDMDDDIMKDSILAKKEVNAEIKEHAPTMGDHILPSEISNAPPAEEGARLSMTEMLKEKVTHAAIAVKETIQNLH